jgi:hypothetical protein
MLPSNMLPFNLTPIIDVTFSTPTDLCTSLRRLFAKIRVSERNRDFSPTTRDIGASVV